MIRKRLLPSNLSILLIGMTHSEMPTMIEVGWTTLPKEKMQDLIIEAPFQIPEAPFIQGRKNNEPWYAQFRKKEKRSRRL